jgi:hypothetical protein
MGHSERGNPMANWEHNIDLRDIWKEYDEEKIDVVTAGKKVAQALRKFKLTAIMVNNLSDSLDEVIFLFEHESETEEEFNFALNELYDWGDVDLPTPKGKMQRKLAWIAVQF